MHVYWNPRWKQEKRLPCPVCFVVSFDFVVLPVVIVSVPNGLEASDSYTINSLRPEVSSSCE